MKEDRSQLLESPANLLAHLSDKVSFGFGLGLLPKAPGSWGSLLGLPLAWGGYHLCRYLADAQEGGMLAGRSFIYGLILLSLLSWLSTLCIARTEARWGRHDDRRIVIDEVVGQMVAVIWFSPSWTVMLAGYVLFRFFDITKPGPIGWIDRKLNTPFGTLGDDLLAGVFASLALGLFKAMGW